MKKRRAERPYSVDKLVRGLASSLARDFRSNLPLHPDAGNIVSILEHGSVAQIREIEWDTSSITDAYTFKCMHQMKSLFKKYRFSKDLYSSSELEEAAEKQFLTNQLRLQDYSLENLPSYLEWVLFYARGYCHEVLGNYDLEEHIALSRFGRKASVGIPMRKACEAERYEIPISGSMDHISWFADIYLPADVSARNYVYRQIHHKESCVFKEIDSLALTFVPKTFKSLRSIMPNTTIGSFYSDGLGKVVAKRLKAAGYDIRSLQNAHGEMARLGSITGELVTADQSLASDNITLSLVKAIVPNRWFNELNRGRIDKVKLPSGQIVSTPTFCTMGIGFTFPLQTLIFLSILKAIDRIYTHGRSKISVYGDDLIYDVRMHPFVMLIFDKLGLKINADKTFASGMFRESCGSDYFAGVDVRPFLPRNERGSLVDRKNYELVLYNYINGLRRRWSVEECPLAFDYLLNEVSEVSRGILRVPPDYPDESGVKCANPNDTLGLTYRLSPVKFGKHGQVSFKYLRFVPDLKEETRHAPYLWRKLGKSGSDDSFHHHSSGSSPCGVNRRLPILRTIEVSTGVDRATQPVFSTGRGQSTASKERFIRSVQRKQPKRATFISEPGGKGRVLRQTGVSVHWTP